MAGNNRTAGYVYADFIVGAFAPEIQSLLTHISRRMKKEVAPLEVLETSSGTKLEAAKLTFISVVSKSILVPLAAPVLDRRFLRGNDEPQSSSVIFVRRESNFHTFQDLHQSVFAFNDPNSLSGFHSMKFHIHTGRYDLPYFSRAVETGGHERSLDTLLCSEADCAAVDVDVVRRLRKNRVWRQRLMELRKIEDVGELGPYPAQPFVVPSYFSAAQVESFREALCSATAKELRPLNWKKLSPVSAETYDPIASLLESCKGIEIICPKDCYSRRQTSGGSADSAQFRRSHRRKVLLEDLGHEKKRARC